jgi:hypothetical protein
MEIIAHHQSNEARMVSLHKCVLTTTECISLLKIGMLKALEVRARWDLPVVVTEDTEEVQDLVLAVTDLIAETKPLKVALDQVLAVVAQDLATEVKVNPLEAMKDLGPWVVALDLATEVKVNPLEVMKGLALDLALVLEVMEDQTVEVTMALALDLDLALALTLDLDLALALVLVLEAMEDQTAEVTMEPPQEVMKDLLLVVMGDQVLAQDLAAMDPSHLDQTVVLVKHLLGIASAPGAMVAQVA